MSVNRFDCAAFIRPRANSFIAKLKEANGRMRVLFGLLIIFLAISLLLIDFGVGALLHWIMPRTSLGIGVLVGVAAGSVALITIGRLPVWEMPEEAAAETSDGSRATVYNLAAVPARRRSRRKRKVEG